MRSDIYFVLLQHTACLDSYIVGADSWWTIIPKWSHLNDFLYERFRTLESVSGNRVSDCISPKMAKSQNRPVVKIKPIKKFLTKVKVPHCSLCPSEAQIIIKCSKFFFNGSQGSFYRDKKKIMYQLFFKISSVDKLYEQFHLL